MSPDRRHTSPDEPVGARSGEPPPSRPGGRVVPVYAVTGGRTRSGGRDLPIESLVTVTDRAAAAEELQIEHRAILNIAAKAPVSLAEIGAGLHVPVGVARVLVGDLAVAGYLVVHAPPPAVAGGGPAPDVLERLLEGLLAR